MRWDGARIAGLSAAVFWAALCVRWFDVAAPWRPGWLAALPPALLALALAAALSLWAWARGPLLAGPRLEPGERRVLLLAVLVAIAARLPIVLGGAAAAITPDGTVYGIVTLRLLEGGEHLVFLPSQPYGGTLAAHLVAPLAAVADLARSYALMSVLFYALYVAGLYRLASRLFGARAALVATLYAAFAPVVVTRYSLNNDGTYVQLLALGTWALWLLVRWIDEPQARPLLAFAIGLLLGLCFWLHIFAVIHVAAFAAAMVAFRSRQALRSLAAVAAGGVLGALPALLWNAASGWASFEYFVPGPAQGAERGAHALVSGLGSRLAAMGLESFPVLMGYDAGYGAALDRALLALGWLGVIVAGASVALALREAVRRRAAALAAVLLFLALNLAVVGLALRHVPGNPRYLLTVMSVLPALVGGFFGTGWRRVPLLLLIAGSALASMAQVPPTWAADARWRQFVARLEAEGVRHCYTDFHLATRINFLSRERVLCSSKLGPTTTEFFADARQRVEAAPQAAYVAVNRTAAGRISRRLDELGVRHEQLDLMKPVLLRLGRKVDPAELFPWREFPVR